MFLCELAISWRMLLRRPGATLLAIISLALAIGFSTAAFSVVDAYYWRGLPVKDPARLAYAAARDREGREGEINWAEYQAIAEQGGALAGIAVQDRAGPPVRLPDRLDFPITAGVSNNFFDVLGVPAAMGRLFHVKQDVKSQVVVISNHYWRTAFSGDVDICGKTIVVGRATLTVVGVLPPDFSGTQRGILVDLFVPEQVMFGSLQMDSPAERSANFEPIVRLNPGANLEAARRSMDQALRRVESAGLAPGPERRAVIVSFTKPDEKPATNMGDVFPWIAALVLTIAAANFANLRLVENQLRRRETGIRLALGAGRASLFRQHLTESLLVAGVATGLGLLVADWLIELAPAVLYSGQRYLDYFIRLDARAFAFSAGAMLLVAVAGALIPMRDTWKCGIVPALQAVTAPTATRWLAALVVLQIGLITAFTDSAGLLWRSLYNVAAIRPAMDPDRDMLLIQGVWTGGRDARARIDALAKELNAIPGVVDAAYGRRVMMAGSGGGQRVAFERPGQLPLTFRFNQVSPNYFAATGARVLKGRMFSGADGPDATPVAMVSSAFARKFFPRGDALNAWARIDGKDRQIVGIVEDGPSNNLKENVEPFLYFPFAQRPSGDFTFFLHTAMDAGRVIAAARERIRKSESAFLPVDFLTLAQHLRAQRQEEELAADVSGGLALLGIVLAAAGLFGVILYAVKRRLREFGIRVALGATPATLSRQVLREALRMAAAGVALGGVLCVAFLHLLRTYLFGVKPGNASAFAVAAIVVTLVALLAAATPARRAAQADPIEALRME